MNYFSINAEFGDDLAPGPCRRRRELRPSDKEQGRRKISFVLSERVSGGEWRPVGTYKTDKAATLAMLDLPVAARDYLITRYIPECYRPAAAPAPEQEAA